MKKNKNILLLVESSTAYGRKISLGVSQYAKEQGNWILHVEERDVFSIFRLLAQEWKGDGVIARTTGTSFRNVLNRVSCPIVEILGTCSGKDKDITSDERRILELGIAHYQENRIISVAFYGFGKNWWIKEREKAFLEITRQHGLDSHCFVDTSSQLPTQQPQWSKNHEKALIAWLKTLPSQTGLIAANDSQAIRVLNTCRKIGIAVPEQMAILGIDNDEFLCNLVMPSLSSVDHNVEMVGYKAAELLNHRMTGPRTKRKSDKQTNTVFVPPRGVVVRNSSKISAVGDEDVAAALRFIAERALLGIRVSEVTDHVGVSRATLYRRFYQVLNRSPHDEIVRIRVEHAKFLLAKTNMSIRAIAGKSCYPAIEYFTSVFRRHTGQTPACYRREAWKFKLPDADHEE